VEDSDSSSEEDEVLASIFVGDYRFFTDFAEEERQQHTKGKRKVDMRGKNNTDRSKKKDVDHTGTLVCILACINRDNFGPNVLLGAEFSAQFRISRARFQSLLEDVTNSTDHKFFQKQHHVFQT
jgi:hypothetical protein